MDEKTEILLNILTVFLLVIIIYGGYKMFIEKDEFVMNEKLINNLENLQFNNSNQQVKNKDKQIFSEKIIVINKNKNNFCEYYDDKERCFNLDIYSNYYNNIDFLNYKDYIIKQIGNYTFIINDFLNTTPQVIVE